jgi:hypothetical protein
MLMNVEKPVRGLPGRRAGAEREQRQAVLMNVEQLQAESGVSRYTWRSWIKARRVPSVRLGRRVFVARVDFEKLIKAGRVEARPAGK